MNILMTSCGCLRLEAVAKSASKEWRGNCRQGTVGRVEEEREGLGRGSEEQTAAEGKSSVSPFLGNYNRATYRGTARPFLRFSFPPFHPATTAHSHPLPLQDVGFILR